MAEASPHVKRKCLARLLKQAREKAGLSQRQFAPRLQQPQSFVSKYERLERQLDLIELEEICEALGTPLGRLVTRYQQAVKAEQAEARKPVARASEANGCKQPAKGRVELHW